MVPRNPRYDRARARKRMRQNDGPVPVSRRVGLARPVPTYNVKRTMVESTFTLSNTWTGAQWVFRLDKLPDFAEFNSLFTHYRINGVRMTFIPHSDSLDSTTQINAVKYITTPRLYTYVDRDAQPPTSSENAVIQHSDLKIIREPLKPFTVYVKNPAVAEGLQTTSSVAYSGVRPATWISCDSPSVNHYGAVTGGILPFTAGAATLAYNVICTYYLQFRGNQ